MVFLVSIELSIDFQINKTIESDRSTPMVVLENISSKKKVEVLGLYLEAQYRAGDNFILFLTEGNSFEEALYIYYLDNNLQTLDAIELSAPFAEGVLANLSVINSDEIEFSFFDKTERWLLKILPSSRYILLGNKYPIKKLTPFFHRSWLSLKNHP